MARTKHGSTTVSRPALEDLEARQLPATFVVSNVLDSGIGSLRQAIMQSNARPGADRIVFRIESGVPSIALQSALPDITDTVNIDGRTQPGVINTPLVELNGEGIAADLINGLTIRAPRTRVLSLVINRFSGSGIVVYNEGASGAVIQGNFLGTDVSGRLKAGNANEGVYVGPEDPNGTVASPSHVLIGGQQTWQRNLISGNGMVGIVLRGPNRGGTRVEGNLVGTDIDGKRALGNRHDGIQVVHSPGNTIGGPRKSQRNVVSGNGEGLAGSGIELLWEGSKHNRVQGNYCGTDIDGEYAIPNGLVGIAVGGEFDGNGGFATANTIGGSRPGEGNLTSGNVQSGIYLSGRGAQGNVVQGNRSGTNASGTRAIPNQRDGIQIARAANNQIGGTRPGEGNLLSGNLGSGLTLLEQNTRGNVIEGNWIGTDVSGLRALPNQVDGIGSGESPEDPGGFPSANIIGGSRRGAGNLISGNRAMGISVTGIANGGNLIEGNIIGADRTGKKALGNGEGVLIATPGNRVLGNLISGNVVLGLQLLGQYAVGNVIQGNRIGTDINGQVSLGEQKIGVQIAKSSIPYFGELAPSGNWVGGWSAQDANIIAGNTEVGLLSIGRGTTPNHVAGNLIGVNANSSAYLPNLKFNTLLIEVSDLDLTPNVYAPQVVARPARHPWWGIKGWSSTRI